ncbi:SCAN box domain-containing protein [Trichonephila clavipes]|nr:SCAN box domain-containing protein [Trichonephila clavipes]
MAYLAKSNKPDLLSVCEEMGVEVDQSSKVVDINKLILNSEFYVEEEVKIILDRVINDRKERERSKQEEREGRSKQEEREGRSKQEEREEREREREERMAREARQHELELRKLELSQQNQPLNDESGRRFETGPKIQLTQITTKFDEKDDEISLYLINFERKAELAMILHQKSAEKSWRNYAHELNSYFTEWIAELKVKTFKQLKDLFITGQLKYRVPAEVREHFLDDWIKLKTPYELTEKLDEYESIKQSFRREIPKKNSYKFQGGVNYSGARPKETPKDFKSKFQIKKEPVYEKITRQTLRREDSFDVMNVGLFHISDHNVIN